MAEVVLDLLTDSATVTISGDAVIDSAALLHQTFCKALDSRLSVAINTDAITECDLSFIQLIGSLCHSLEKDKRTLTFQDNHAAEPVCAAVRNAGFHFREHCTRAAGRECLFSAIMKNMPSRENPSE